MRLLCPVDFSEHSLQAVKYAVDISRYLNGDLYLLNVVTNAGINEDFEEELKKQREKLEKLVAGINWSSEGKILPFSFVNRGPILETFNHFIKRHKIDLICLGTEGMASLSNMLYGSTTEKVVSKIKLPVLAFPKKAKTKLTENPFLLALDNKAINDDLQFEFVNELAKATNNKVNVVHVDSKEETVPFDLEMVPKLKEVLGDYIYLRSNNVEQALKEYAEKNNTPLLIMIRRKHGFWNRLFFQSHTQNEILASNVPVFVIPNVP